MIPVVMVDGGGGVVVVVVEVVPRTCKSLGHPFQRSRRGAIRRSDGACLFYADADAAAAAAAAAHSDD